MSSLAKVSVVETFRSKLKNEWKQRPDCSTHGQSCLSVRHFVKTTLLKQWMAQKENTTCKTNGERLIDEVNPISWLGRTPTSILKGDKACVLVLSCLLHQVYGKEGNSKEGHGNLVYIFQSAGIIDKDLQNAPRSFEKLRSELTWRKVRGVDAIIEHFERKMWAYCPMILRDGLDKDFESKLYLPFIIHDRVGTGGTATVFKVRLQQEFVSTEIRIHLEKPFKDPMYGDCYEFALKTFPEEQLQTYKKESEAFDGLRNEPGMIRSFGHYSCSDTEGVKTYNILLEYGRTDLLASFSEEDPPQLPAEIVSYWKKISNVAAALKAFHSRQHYDGWHGDVKPGNILRVKNEWKLADFGFAEFSKTDKNIQHLPKIVMEGGTETYGAPECAQAKAVKSDATNVGFLYQTIDTWSFGCVLSETATWVVKGSLGIDHYRTSRQMNTKKQKLGDISDAFHDGFDVLPEIRGWHTLLKSVRRISDSITPKVLDLVDEKMLIKDPRARISSNELCDRLKEIVTNAEKSERSGDLTGAGSLDSAKLALLSTELPRGSTTQSAIDQFIEVEHVTGDTHDTQRLRVSPPPSHSRHFLSISQRRETLERDFHDRGFEVSMGPETVSSAGKPIYAEQRSADMVDRPKLYQAPQPTRADPGQSQGFNPKPAAGHAVATKGKEVGTARGSAKANDADVGTRYDRSQDSSQQKENKSFRGSASQQKKR